MQVAGGKINQPDRKGLDGGDQVTPPSGEVVEFLRLLAKILWRKGNVAVGNSANADSDDETLTE